MDTPQERIEHLLRERGVPWTRLTHRRVTSSAEAAEVRGTPLEIGGKTLVFKAGGQFVLVVVPGHARIDNRAFRKAVGVQRYRFANAEELAATVGLEPGCIPPFGRPIFDLPLWMDAGFARQARIAFTVASHTTSAVMSMEDYLRLAQPTLAPLARDPDR
jgi:prolyl-tRNA editing enzyme YbaK/EbsC (Cys-tRNA(Pro) deacylase)